MGNKIKALLNRDDFDVLTDQQTVVGNGIKKFSTTTVYADDDQPGEGVKIGLRILVGQQIGHFEINGKKLYPNHQDQSVTDELAANFKKDGFQWWGFFLKKAWKPGKKFKTVLQLNPLSLNGLDKQVVDIYAAYGNQLLTEANSANILRGHSMFVAPTRAGRRRTKKDPKKRIVKRAARSR